MSRNFLCSHWAEWNHREPKLGSRISMLNRFLARSCFEFFYLTTQIYRTLMTEKKAWAPCVGTPQIMLSAREDSRITK